MVHNQMPRRIQIQHHGAFALFQEVILGTSRGHSWRDRFATDDVEAGDQTQRTVPDL